MIQISSLQVSPALTALFNPNLPTAIRCFAVLAGGNQGKIFTDDPLQPRWGLVWEADDGILYPGGELDAGTVRQAVAHLQQESLVAIAYHPGDAWVELFPPNPDGRATCLKFDRPVGASDLDPLIRSLPEGYELRRLDRTLLERSPHYEGTLVRYGSLENFLAHGLGVTLLSGEQTVCEVYADMAIGGVRELGVTTQEPFRGQGFATIACAQIIRWCEEEGSATYWDCVDRNLASAALARRLGFQNEQKYKMMAWFKQG